MNDLWLMISLFKKSSALGIHTALQLATAPRSSTSLQEIPLPTALLQEYPGQHGRKNLLQIQMQIWQIWQIPRLQSLGSISFPRCLRSSTDAPPIWTMLKIDVDLPCSKRHVNLYVYIYKYYIYIHIHITYMSFPNSTDLQICHQHLFFPCFI